MPEIPKFKLQRSMLIAGALAVLVAGLLLDDLRLHSNLRSSTKITQALRDEVEQLRSEKKILGDQTVSEKTKVQTLSAELDTLKQDKDVSLQRQEELKSLVSDAEKALENQNKKIAEMEMKLKEAEDKIRRQKKASESLEKQTKSAKANPSMTAEYVRLVENEWLSATEKTESMKKDLDRTLSELAGQNKERTKLRSETATMHYNLAVILTEQRNFPAAVREYQKVLETRPDDADAHYNLAIIYDDYLKDSARALEHYRQYIQFAPNSPEAPRVRQWIKDKEVDTAFKFKL